MRSALICLTLLFCAAPLIAQGRQSNFAHEQKDHLKVECAKCHTVTSAKPRVTKFPGHATCIACHNFAKETTTRFVQFCAECHSGIPESPELPALFRFPKRDAPSDFGISFSHVSHSKPFPQGRELRTGSYQVSQGQSLKCVACHQVQLAVMKVPDVITGFDHSSCFVCHGQQPVASPSMKECRSCHELGGATRPKLYAIVPGFLHDDHRFDTRPRKKGDVRKIDLCSECHATLPAAASLKEIRLPKQNYCLDCHNSRVGLPDVLKADVLGKLAQR